MPVFSEEMEEEFLNSDPSERSRMVLFYEELEVINAQDGPHLVSFVLTDRTSFGSPPGPRSAVETAAPPAAPGPSSGGAREISEGDIIGMKGEVDLLRRKYPRICLRVYLSGSMSRLTGPLREVGFEIHLMRDDQDVPSDLLWQYLAFCEEGRLVTLGYFEDFGRVATDVNQTEDAAQNGLGLWRIPNVTDERDDKISYMPLTRRFGGRGGFIGHSVFAAFTWHFLKGNISREGLIPGCGRRLMDWADNPLLDLDRAFLCHVLYPRLIEDGVLTIVPAKARSYLLSLDIEYVTWVNPRSELFFADWTGCCGGATVRNRSSAVREERKEAYVRPRIQGADRYRTGNRKRPLWITCDYLPGSRSSGVTATRLLVSSLLRNLKEAEILHISTDGRHLFDAPRLGLREVGMDSLEGAAEGDPRMSVLCSAGRQFAEDPEQWLVFPHPLGIAFRNLDHLIPPDLDGKYSLPKAHLIWANVGVPKVIAPHLLNAGSDADFFSPCNGLWAVRAGKLEQIKDCRAMASAGGQGKAMDDMAGLISALSNGDAPLHARRFERGEVIAPRAGAIEWNSVQDAAFVTLADWPHDLALKFQENLYIGSHPNNRDGQIVGLLAP